MMNQPPPKVFISYAWESDRHAVWVKNLATRLRKDGVETTLDVWHVSPGDKLPFFMEQIDRNDYVLMICTPKYKEKFDARRGGVGYEGDIMTSDALQGTDERKYIPLLREGAWKDAAPIWVRGKCFLDFREGEEDQSGSVYEKLLDTLHNTREGIPIVEHRNRSIRKRRLDILRDLEEEQ